MSREDPQMKIRLPEALKARIEASAAEAGRSLNAELVHRIQRSYESGDSGALDLAPTVARMERDIAKLEVEKASETLTIRVVAASMRPLLDDHAEDEVLSGMLEGATVADWKALCDAYLKNKMVRKSDLDSAFERLKSAEAAVRSALPEAADPIWEQMTVLRAAHEANAKRSGKAKT